MKGVPTWVLRSEVKVPSAWTDKGNTHYGLIVYRHLLHHLLPLSTSRRVVRSWTNVVVVDDFSQIFEEPGNLFVISNMFSKFLQHGLLR